MAILLHVSGLRVPKEVALVERLSRHNVDVKIRDICDVLDDQWLYFVIRRFNYDFDVAVVLNVCESFFSFDGRM